VEKLIKACKKYDRKAQREMVNHLAPYLMSICQRYAPNKEDARDWMQESLIKIFNNIEQCKTNEFAFKGWCRKIAINVCLGKIRKKGLKTVELKNEYETGIFQPKIIEQMNVKDILRLLDHLPQKLKLVFNLSVLDGYSHKEIAESLKIKESSSRTFLTRARTKMQQLIIEQEINSTNGK